MQLCRVIHNSNNNIMMAKKQNMTSGDTENLLIFGYIMGSQLRDPTLDATIGR